MKKWFKKKESSAASTSEAEPEEPEIKVDIKEVEYRRSCVGENMFVPDFVLSRLFKCQPTEEKAKAAVTHYAELRTHHMKEANITTPMVDLKDCPKEERKNKMLLFSGISKSDSKVPVHIAYFEIKRHFRHGDTSLSEKICHILYYFEEAVSRMEKRGGELFVMIDASSIALKNADLTILHHLSTLQKVYRDLISKIFVVNANPIFNQCWKVAKLWFSPRIHAKINFIKGDKLRELLEKETLATLDVVPDRFATLWDKGAAEKYKDEIKEMNKLMKDEAKEEKAAAKGKSPSK